MAFASYVPVCFAIFFTTSAKDTKKYEERPALFLNDYPEGSKYVNTSIQIGPILDYSQRQGIIWLLSRFGAYASFPHPGN